MPRRGGGAAGAVMILGVLADLGAGGWRGMSTTAGADVRACARPARGQPAGVPTVPSARSMQNASAAGGSAGAAGAPARSGKRLPTVLKLAGDARPRQVARSEWGCDVEMQCVGSSVTSDASASLDSASRGVHVALGCAATEGSQLADGSGWGRAAAAFAGAGDADGAMGSEGELERVREELRLARSENLALREVRRPAATASRSAVVAGARGRGV
jgi:hypothetical protein